MGKQILIAILIAILAMAIGCGDDGSNAGGNHGSMDPIDAHSNNQYDANGNYIKPDSSNEPYQNDNATMGDELSDLLGNWVVKINVDGERFTFNINFYHMEDDLILGEDSAGNTVAAMFKDGVYTFAHEFPGTLNGGYQVVIYGNEMEGCFVPTTNDYDILGDECFEVSGYK